MQQLPRICYIDEGHHLIGKYCVEVTDVHSEERIDRVVNVLNDMVFERDGRRNTFIKYHTGILHKTSYKRLYEYIVVRKLKLGDPTYFINETLLGDRNEYKGNLP